jgi:hypothetical protein
MTTPWNITGSVNNASTLFPMWVGANYILHHNRPCLCNWFPMQVRYVGWLTVNYYSERCHGYSNTSL